LLQHSSKPGETKQNKKRAKAKRKRERKRKKAIHYENNFNQFSETNEKLNKKLKRKYLGLCYAN
jgi:pullulanase/glycogen debranching enzyme